MVDFLNTTGKRVRILRQDLRLNQSALVRELRKLGIKIGQTYVSKIENNDVVPSGAILAGLAQVLQTTTDYLLLLTDDPLRPGEEEEPEEEAPALSPEMQALLDRLEALPAADRQFILRTMNSLMDFAESHDQPPVTAPPAAVPPAPGSPAPARPSGPRRQAQPASTARPTP